MVSVTLYLFFDSVKQLLLNHIDTVQKAVNKEWMAISHIHIVYSALTLLYGTGF